MAFHEAYKKGHEHGCQLAASWVSNLGRAAEVTRGGAGRQLGLWIQSKFKAIGHKDHCFVNLKEAGVCASFFCLLLRISMPSPNTVLSDSLPCFCNLGQSISSLRASVYFVIFERLMSRLPAELVTHRCGKAECLSVPGLQLG